MKCNSQLEVSTFAKHGEAAIIMLADWNEAALSVDSLDLIALMHIHHGHSCCRQL